ncbi:MULTISPECIES: YkvI family membrane protein [Corynebacterium]|uniref:Membrane protein YkvI n=1 Tax=Corynebacterium xerosis TaxID=1725 RepID=A0ABV3UTM6_9CORY|nr:hypothetical protein [Corynebacterium sp.]
MLKRSIAIAMAVVGLIVGAGFASGQEMMQYFVAFGRWGIAGAVLAGVVMAAAAAAVLSLASYFLAGEHTAVFDRISSPIMSRILDVAVMVTLFSTGFVMFAGAGANLRQQFDLPLWVGSLLMVVLVALTGMLDVDKVTRIIGAISPFIIVFLVGASIYSIIRADGTLAELEPATEGLLTTLPNWWVSAVNYVGFNFMVAVSMAIVIGGTHLNPREAGVGGLLGGAIFGGLLIIVSVALFYSVEAVGGDDMPMLTIVDRVNPALGVAMAVVVYGMIFNTAIGMFYALGKRLTRNRKDRFRPVFLGSVAVGLALSFIGFQTLVSTVYPAIGYIGIVLIIVVIVARMTGRAKLAEEAERRAVIRDLVRRRLDPRAVFSRDDSARLEREVAASNADDRELIDTVRSEVSTELDDGPATPQSAETTKESDR